jgi:4-carboxymuconolactone decarboxylase
MSKVEPLLLAEMDERTRALLEVTASMSDRAEPLNVFGTLAHHPKLLAAWLPFGGRLLLGGQLDRSLTELLILRTAWNTRSDYEWGQHVKIALDLGMAREAIDLVPAGGEADGWTDLESLALRACDELHALGRVDDATFDALGAHLSTSQLLELCFLVGHYEMLAMALRTLEVELDPGLEALPSDTAR